MKQKDLDCILSVLQYGCAHPVVDWYAVLGFLQLNRLAVPLYFASQNAGLALPQQVKRKLAETQRQQTARNAVMAEWAFRIGQELEGAGIKHAFLKGAILCGGQFAEKGRLYRPGERVSNDIDVLIGQKDISAAGRVLKGLGLAQGYWDLDADVFREMPRSEIVSRRMNRGETAPYILPLAGDSCAFIEVDVNFSLDHLAAGRNVNYFLQDVKRYEHGVYGLEETKFFLHLLLHQYKEATVYSMVMRGKDTELYKYYDIYLFLKNDRVDYERLYGICAALHLEREAYLVLSGAAEIFESLRKNEAFVKFLTRIKPNDTSYCNEVYDPAVPSKKYVHTKPLWDRLLSFGSIDLAEGKPC